MKFLIPLLFMLLTWACGAPDEQAVEPDHKAWTPPKNHHDQRPDNQKYLSLEELSKRYNHRLDQLKKTGSQENLKIREVDLDELSPSIFNSFPVPVLRAMLDYEEATFYRLTGHESFAGVAMETEYGTLHGWPVVKKTMRPDQQEVKRVSQLLLSEQSYNFENTLAPSEQPLYAVRFLRHNGLPGETEVATFIFSFKNNDVFLVQGGVRLDIEPGRDDLLKIFQSHFKES